ncbi:uncharacterized protein DS421_17g594490 [Arachis hypogaea]|nr:uncharacterized protein DS421_17g594490 [Arachis hypogaea]
MEISLQGQFLAHIMNSQFFSISYEIYGINLYMIQLFLFRQKYKKIKQVNSYINEFFRLIIKLGAVRQLRPNDEDKRFIFFIRSSKIEESHGLMPMFPNSVDPL